MVYSEITIILEESVCFHAEGTRVNSSEVFEILKCCTILMEALGFSGIATKEHGVIS